MSSTKNRWPRRLLTFLGLAVAVALLIIFVNSGLDKIFQPLDRLISIIENNYSKWLDSQALSNPVLLVGAAFGGGLLASISPCILAMLPVNLSYIGTLNITSRRDAVIKAGGFVLGVVCVLSAFGLFSSFASAVIVDFKGYIYVVVGIIIILMGLSFAGLFHLPLSQSPINIPVAGPFGVGLTFALVSSPCASPVLFAVLAAAATSGSTVWSVLTMISYALGYTAIIFAASVFAGLMKFRSALLAKSEAITRWGGFILVVMGGYYLIAGLQQFL